MNLTKIQKILIWVPLLNVSVFFIWAWICYKEKAVALFTKKWIVSLCTLLALFVSIGIEITLYNYFFADNASKLYLLLYYVEGVTMGGLCYISQNIIKRVGNKENEL